MPESAQIAIILAFNFEIRYTKIMERTKHFILKGLLEADFAGNIMVKELKYIKTIRSFRRRRHSK